MSISKSLLERCQNKCELCSADSTMHEYLVPPKSEETDDNQVVLCDKCMSEIASSEQLDENHWRCLNESMWSEVPVVQVLAYRLLSKLSSHDWAVDLKNMMYLDEKNLEWAESDIGTNNIVHKDSNGHILSRGDSVVLIKDLNVKGANFTAKRGTAVRRISLVPDNENHIEGKINGQHIVILTQYVKKT